MPCITRRVTTECSKIEHYPNELLANTNLAQSLDKTTFIVHVRPMVVQHHCVIFSTPALVKAVCWGTGAPVTCAMWRMLLHKIETM